MRLGTVNANSGSPTFSVDLPGTPDFNALIVRSTPLDTASLVDLTRQPLFRGTGIDLRQATAPFVATTA